MKGRHLDNCAACRERMRVMDYEELVGTIWARVEVWADGEPKDNGLMGDITVEVKRYLTKVEDYYASSDESVTVEDDFLEVLTDEGQSEIWPVTSFMLTHYRLPGGN